MAVVPANLIIIQNNYSKLTNTYDRAQMALIPNGGNCRYIGLPQGGKRPSQHRPYGAHSAHSNPEDPI